VKSILTLQPPTIKKLKETPKLSALLFIDKLYVLTVVYLNEMFYITSKQEVTPPCTQTIIIRKVCLFKGHQLFRVCSFFIHTWFTSIQKQAYLQVGQE
jgi:hypothetical protein